MEIIKKVCKFILNFILFVIVSVLLTLTYSKHIEPKMLVVKDYDINEIKNKENNMLRVVQFTDVQLGEFYTLEQLEKVVEKINKQNADIVVFTGDLIDKTSAYEDRDKISSVLSNINAKIGKYAVWGNHDYGGGGHAYYERIMVGSGFKVLKNETVRVPMYNNKYISISGLDEAMFGEPNSKSIIKKINKTDFNLLLLHEPDLISQFNNSNINLALAGHSHGGQVALPFLGAIITPPIAKEYTKGFYDIDNDMKLYVNSGIGNTRLPYRFMNIPQISVFDINI
ncbi:MAG: metallophosphoesterase [Romboutsia sp.]|uniref:metallophosphoesterase n=1 Tax=Romboutsia sp. TaxID=1965302 RepID=UPI003F3D3095